MENKLQLPASYAPVCKEEMAYLDGGSRYSEYLTRVADQFDLRAPLGLALLSVLDPVGMGALLVSELNQNYQSTPQPLRTALVATGVAAAYAQSLVCIAASAVGVAGATALYPLYCVKQAVFPSRKRPAERGGPKAHVLLFFVI